VEERIICGDFGITSLKTCEYSSAALLLSEDPTIEPGEITPSLKVVAAIPSLTKSDRKNTAKMRIKGNLIAANNTLV
jgi:hypothetical protein